MLDSSVFKVQIKTQRVGCPEGMVQEKQGKKKESLLRSFSVNLSYCKSIEEIYTCKYTEGVTDRSVLTAN